MNRAGVVLFLVALTWFSGCQKKDSATSSSRLGTLSKSEVALSPLSYGDSIFYPDAKAPDRKIWPVSIPEGPGYFISNPSGLSIDPRLGRIDLSKSEAGIRYKVYWLSLLHQPLDSTIVTISGIDYKDAIYDLSTGTSADHLAKPIYNMQPGAPLPCNSSAIAGCIFDETDLDGNGSQDIPGANRNNLIVDTTNGNINLDATFTAGLFGPNPSNGDKKDVTFFYRLNDNSERRLKRITIRLVYFRQRAYIPESLIMEINERNKRDAQLLASSASSPSTSVSSLSTTLSYSISVKPKRPPLIVIVSGL